MTRIEGQWDEQENHRRRDGPSAEMTVRPVHLDALFGENGGRGDKPAAQHGAGNHGHHADDQLPLPQEVLQSGLQKPRREGAPRTTHIISSSAAQSRPFRHPGSGASSRFFLASSVFSR